MPSLQKIALYIFFDAIERDLISKIRDLNYGNETLSLTHKEIETARKNLLQRDYSHDLEDQFELLEGLNLGEKFDILLRGKAKMDVSCLAHYKEVKPLFGQCIGVRNTVMHGRPLTIDEYAKAFALTNKLKLSPAYWPELCRNLEVYTANPSLIAEKAVRFLDDFEYGETLNNLPIPDYDDTGFFPRPKIERELRKKIMGRHPVVTVLGDGGDGKTAVTLQTLYGMLNGNDHDFDAIIWISAKSSKLTVAEVERIKTEITTSLSVFNEFVNIFEDSSDEPIAQVRKLMEEHKILLVIDNLETIIDKSIQDFASDIPGDSKLLLTSRIPLGSDLTVKVNPFTSSEAVSFLRALILSYNVSSLRKETNDKLQYFAGRLLNKPLLLKWFILGVVSGLDPAKIVGNPEVALKFCLENVFEALSADTKKHLSAMATLPRAVSLAMLEHVSGDGIHAIEASMAELMRFSIIEQRDDVKFESVFHIKPLAKSYLVRVLKAKHKDAELILKKYREIEAIYQSEREEVQHNIYNPLHYTVRSKSEALAVAKLRHAVTLARTNEFVKSFEIIDNLKISHPDYYEVPRTEAYIAQLSGYTPRAQEAHISALELGKSQPQIHLFYGWFLRQVFNDFDGALSEFQSGLTIDPHSSSLLSAVGQVYMFKYEFSKAETYLEKASQQKINNRKEKAIICDLRIQVYSRHLEYLAAKNQLSAAIEPTIYKLLSYIKEMDLSLLDSTMNRHLKRARTNMLRHMDDPSRYSKDERENATEIFDRLLNSSEGDGEIGVDFSSAISASNRIVGSLKEAGRKESFGFLVSDDKVETYVERRNVSSGVWHSMLSGRMVSYCIQPTDDHRTKAVDIRIHKP
ncbi:MAG: hypothetical protein COB08_011045 [Rhodobacteraceae bacterium]|nr:hypothetical protein [Paracoccaceae bacterium]